MPSRRPWFRFYTAWRTDPRVQQLRPWMQAAAINLLCLAAENKRPGHIELDEGKPYPLKVLARALNVHPKDVWKLLTRLRDDGVFGLTFEDVRVELPQGSGEVHREFVRGSCEVRAMFLQKWDESQTKDPTSIDRQLRYRANLDNRDRTVNTPLQDREQNVNRTLQSRVEKSRREENPPYIPPSQSVLSSASAVLGMKHQSPTSRTVSEAFIAKMQEKYAAAWPPVVVEEIIQAALAHKAARKYTDMELYVQNWLRKEAESHRNPVSFGDADAGGNRHKPVDFDNSPGKYFQEAIRMERDPAEKAKLEARYKEWQRGETIREASGQHVARGTAR